jgi:hypothetical protein
MIYVRGVREFSCEMRTGLKRLTVVARKVFVN